MEPLKLIRAVIFDLDGTLLNSIGDIAACANEVLASFGYPTVPVERYRAYVGDGLTNLCRKVLPPNHSDDEVVSVFLERYRSLYRAKWRNTTTVYAGVPELLTQLERRGILLAILSNKSDDFTKVCVAEMLPAWTFAEVVGASDNSPIKPHPGGALRIAAQLGLSSAECLFVGDSEIDAETARRAGMPFVGVEWGFRTHAQLAHAGATSIIAAPLQLLSFLG